MTHITYGECIEIKSQGNPSKHLQLGCKGRDTPEEIFEQGDLKIETMKTKRVTRKVGSTVQLVTT